MHNRYAYAIVETFILPTGETKETEGGVDYGEIQPVGAE